VEREGLERPRHYEEKARRKILVNSKGYATHSDQCLRFRPFRISILADPAADFPSHRSSGRQAAGTCRLTARAIRHLSPRPRRLSLCEICIVTVDNLHS